MSEQTNISKLDAIIKDMVADYERGLFTFAEFLQALKKVVSEIFVDKLVERAFFNVLMLVLKVEEDGNGN